MIDPIVSATDFLCGSEYPTLNSALPIYLILMKQLTIIQNGLYDQGQLIEPARKMFEKINKYPQSALKNPIYICAMVIDPRFKMHFWKSQIAVIKQHCSQSLEDIKSTYITEAKISDIEKNANAESISSNQKQHKPKNPTLKSI
ncbi:uncharacterized protein VP01_1655g2 [Puccinia sorghi]|uniref:hAT-like transposase RNase-H fold domain-containing protein n=1 Tax=Puccinia sorghi TaxID=27349 RepID=A0A0L6VH15_9BASI|nr:uncharacterized protein VP01_1655g2 [Puccinia sorghi]